MKSLRDYITENMKSFDWVDELIENIYDELFDFIKNIGKKDCNKEITFESEKEPISIEFEFVTHDNIIELESVGFIDYDATGKGGMKAIEYLEERIRATVETIINEIYD